MEENMANRLLVATPGMQDAVFTESVIYVYQQNEEGTIGFIVNKPLHIKAESILPQLDIKIDKHKAKDLPVFLGGPVSPEQGLVIYENDLIQAESKLLTSQSDEMNIIPDETNHLLIILGHSFWGPGELEKQIVCNAWLIAPFQRNIIFSTEVNQKWKAALTSIGVSLSSFSEEGGHG